MGAPCIRLPLIVCYPLSLSVPYPRFPFPCLVLKIDAWGGGCAGWEEGRRRRSRTWQYLSSNCAAWWQSREVILMLLLMLLKKGCCCCFLRWSVMVLCHRGMGSGLFFTWGYVGILFMWMRWYRDYHDHGLHWGERDGFGVKKKKKDVAQKE